MKYRFSNLPPVIAMDPKEAIRELCAIYGNAKIHSLIHSGARLVRQGN
jgi:hypothetical protein